jgi:hypothetical protein
MNLHAAECEQMTSSLQKKKKAKVIFVILKTKYKPRKKKIHFFPKQS